MNCACKAGTAGGRAIECMKQELWIAVRNSSIPASCLRIPCCWLPAIRSTAWMRAARCGTWWKLTPMVFLASSHWKKLTLLQAYNLGVHLCAKILLQSLPYGLYQKFLAWLSVPVLCMLALPLYILRPFNPDNNRLMAIAMARTGRAILGMKRPLEGAEHMPQDRPVVAIANHQYNDDLLWWAIWWRLAPLP